MSLPSPSPPPPLQRAVLYLTLLFILTGCGSLSGSLSTTRGPDGPFIVPTTLRAVGVVEIKGENYKSRAVILVKSPDLVRIDLLGPLRGVTAVLLSDGEGIAVYSKGKVKGYSWNDPEVPYRFRPDELALILLGQGGQGGEDRDAASVRGVSGDHPLHVAMDDWREVAGARLPFSIVIGSGDERIAVKYRDVEVDPGLSSSLFVFSGDTYR